MQPTTTRSSAALPEAADLPEAPALTEAAEALLQAFAARPVNDQEG